MHKLLVLAGVVVVAAVVQGSSEGPDFSHGLQVIGKVLRHFINSQPEDWKISEGVHLVSTSSPNDATARAADVSFLGTVENYLRTHEVRIKLPELMPDGQDFGRAFKEAVGGVDSSDVGTGRGKGKGGGGGGGGLLILGSMFASMLGAMGVGGVGLLAMKALTVSAMALLLAAVVGVKKLASSGHDDGGHHVIHASSGHGYEHRRKREAAELAYSAWLPESSS